MKLAKYTVEIAWPDGYDPDDWEIEAACAALEVTFVEAALETAAKGALDRSRSVLASMIVRVS